MRNINLYNFLYNSYNINPEPLIEGVFHKYGFSYATDKYFFIKIKDNYDAEDDDKYNDNCCSVGWLASKADALTKLTEYMYNVVWKK